MSAPAAKARSEPVRRMADIEEDVSNAFSAVLSSVINGVERALRAFGRLSVTRGIVSKKLKLREKVEAAYSDQLLVGVLIFEGIHILVTMELNTSEQ
jgi:hypothetical protein